MRRLTYIPLGLATVAALTVSGCGGKRAAKTVTVPRVSARNVVQTYRLLHAAGLKVAIPSGLDELDESGSSHQMMMIKPAQGSIVRRGSVVTIGFRPDAVHRVGSGWVTEGESGDFIYTRGIPPVAKAPDFVGAPLTDLNRWTSKHGFFWESSNLPPLPASGQPQLLDNYVVRHQSPTSGTILRWSPSIHGHTLPSMIEVRLALRPAS
jgi:hypothetical protein